MGSPERQGLYRIPAIVPSRAGCADRSPQATGIHTPVLAGDGCGLPVLCCYRYDGTLH